PTTAASVTEAPTTAAPVTEAPTTAAPVTEVPTTAASVTEAPTTAAPVTEASASASGQELPNTGTTKSVSMVVGTILVIFGGAILFKRKKA
uniref:LPXTG cell wall anchor domain-containing protein n=1 Tax=Streptococcus sp. 263_SSPC TaxID=1579343 RepID=UPI0006600152